MAKNNENGTIVVTETGVLDSGNSNDEKSILYYCRKKFQFRFSNKKINRKRCFLKCFFVSFYNIINSFEYDFDI